MFVFNARNAGVVKGDDVCLTYCYRYLCCMGQRLQMKAIILNVEILF
jgi:hypothetical protein